MNGELNNTLAHEHAKISQKLYNSTAILTNSLILYILYSRLHVCHYSIIDFGGEFVYPTSQMVTVRLIQRRNASVIALEGGTMLESSDFRAHNVHKYGFIASGGNGVSYKSNGNPDDN